MKKILKVFGKILLIAILLIICDVILTYIVEIISTLLIEGLDARIFTLNIFGVVAGRFILYFFVGGWAYLVAVIIYHFSLETDLFYNKFKYIIALAFLFYISVTYRFFGISPILISYFIGVSIIYYVLVKRKVFGETIRKMALWYVIFLLFFFFYWMSELLALKMLILQLIVYVPLAWIGYKAYSRLFQNRMAIPSEIG